MQTKELSITKKNFWDRNAARYDRFMRKNAIAYDQLYALLRPAVWHKTVLEVATGTGRWQNISCVLPTTLRLPTPPQR